MMKQGGKTAVKKSASLPGNEKKKAVEIDKINIVSLSIVVFYVLVEFFPRLDSVDVMGSQWLYLSVLNGIATVYILKNKLFVSGRFFKSALFLFYVGFIVISGLSFFVAYNITESIVTYSRLIIGFIAFLNILCLIYHDSKMLNPLFLILGMLVLIQSLDVITTFLGHFQSAGTLDELITNIKGNTGNKNILAASMVIKLPFLMYAVHQSGYLSRIFFSVSLLVSFIALFIVNARSAYVGLFLEIFIYFLLVIILFFKEGKKLNLLKLPGLIAGIFLVSVVLIQLVFSSVGKQKTTGDYGSVTKRVESISLSNEGSSGRIMLWKSAIDFIKKNPLLGGGYGNWKIHSCAYEGTYQPGWGACESHVHNDFLERCADTGIVGGLIYLGIFAVLFWYFLATLRSPEISMEKKMILGFTSMSLAAFVIDSVFNFPSERPNVQVLFALLMAIIGFSCIDYRQAKSDEKVYSFSKNISVVFLILTLPLMYVSYEVFKSMQVQDKISQEWVGKTKQASVPFNSADIIANLPWIPNINGAGMPMACVKAKYLCQEKKYGEALSLLNADKGSNPYLYFAEYLKSMIALSTGKPDTAYYYAKLAYYNRPANLQLYTYLSGLAEERKDTAEMYKSFHEIANRKNIADLWVKFSQSVYSVTGNDESRMQVILDGIKKYPEDPVLLFQKYFLEGLNQFKAKSFALAIDRFKDALRYRDHDPFCQQDIGFAYINLELYNEALPFFSDVISGKEFTDGKSEFFRGLCYQHINKKDSACADFMTAKSMGYNVNPQLIEGCR